MSRVAKKAIKLVDGVTFNMSGNTVSVKGTKGELSMELHSAVKIIEDNNQLSISPVVEDKKSWAMAGTMRALLNNMFIGVIEGYEKKLKLIGVGYRAAVVGSKVNLTLGFSHPVEFTIPEGITIIAPSQTELTISGIDKQLVGEVSAKIRSFRPPEPYKGKGVRYADEFIKLKEAKKK